MFVGHLALAFASKRVTPRVSLGWLVAAATALDLLWPLLLLAGAEEVAIKAGATAFTPLVFVSYPWSHSLLMACIWGLVLAAQARTMRVSGRGAWMLAALVVSHWVLDVVTHAPDMPLWPGESPHLGLGLWNSIPATFIVEGTLWVAGIAIYLRGRRPTQWKGWVALWSLIVVGTAMWAAGPYLPPPPSERALAWFALIGWVTVPWAAFADRYYMAKG